MDFRRGVLLAVFVFVLVGTLAGCGSKDPTISEEEQERTRQHKQEYEERSNL